MDQVDITLEPLPQTEIEVAGQQGIAGLSAYQLAVKHGYKGSEAEWIAQFQPNALLEKIKMLEAQMTEITAYIGFEDAESLSLINSTLTQGETS